MNRSRGGRLALAFAPLFGGALLLLAPAGGAAAEADTSGKQAAGQEIFGRTCGSCHSIGGGKVVGPDLKGVLERRDRAWVAAHIKAPSAHREQGDEATLANIKEYGSSMPDLGLADQQVADIVAYLETAAGTPLPKEYFPTLALGALGVLGLTVAGLKAGSKKVEVR
ncbi:MAG: cytochrome c [Candidatus Sericytochromatia bacterium]|nr:cytochrome c [Candidatus Tanganyikabacteria bacterium]